MSPHTRRFSQISEDFNSSESSVGVFNNSRSSIGSTKNKDDYGGGTKRTKRTKVSGLNSRFDRMIEEMNATHRSPTKSGPRRTRTVSSSSIGTSDPPRTPLDAYSGLKEGRLGKDFALIKMNTPSQVYDKTVTSSTHMENVPTSHTSKPLPDWLCDTFSTLAAKHPLRLLLPKGSSHASYHSDMPPPGLPDDNPRTPVPEDNTVFAFSAENDPTPATAEDVFAFSAPALPDAPEHAKSSPVEINRLKSPYTSNRSFTFRSISSGDSGFPLVDPLPFSTPGPCFTSVSSPAPSHRPTFNTNHHTSSMLNQAPDISQLDFVPFLAPGPASTLSSAPDLTHMSRLLGRSDIAQRPLSTDHETFASMSSLEDYDQHESCLPQYAASLSDPAPGYSSDEIPDYNAYYEDHLTDDSGSDPHFDQSLLDAHEVSNFYATPGPAFCPSRPIYFDSPTENPSDADPLDPGYKIDYDALDFRWEPFNRKGTEDDVIAPSYNTPQHQIYKIFDEHEFTNAEVDNLPFTPERILSPGPFHFVHDIENSPGISAVVHTDTHEQPPVSQPKTSELQSTAPVFAPAPGIYISPLRDTVDAVEPPSPSPASQSLLATLDRVKSASLKRTKSSNSNSDLKQGPEETPFSSQVSNDSIESWRDAVNAK